MTTEELRDVVQNLHRPDHRPAALKTFQELIALKPADEAVGVINSIGLFNLFNCLKPKNVIDFDLTCDVLKTCFEKLGSGEVIRNYTGYFMFLLRHEKVCVRKLAVEEVYKTMTTNPSTLPVPEYRDVYVAVAQLIIDEDIGIANKALLITSHLPEEIYPKILDEMKIALQYSNSAKCNAFEVITNISVKSPSLLALSAELGYIDHMLADLHSDDVLYQMNVLELMSRLAITPHGIKYLVEHEVLEKMSHLIDNLNTNPLGRLLLVGYMKFFGSVARAHPREVLARYPGLLGAVSAALTDAAAAPAALDTLAFVGGTAPGKLSLAAQGALFTATLETVGELIRAGPAETKVRALHCLASLVRGPEPAAADARLTLMCREWLRGGAGGGGQPMAAVAGWCRSPFPDVRRAALALLDAACTHRWAEEMVAKTPGFIEYLLDRTVSSTKECKEAKYEVIRKLSRSSSFDAGTLLKLVAYVDLGPFYSEQSMQVAMEQED